MVAFPADFQQRDRPAVATPSPPDPLAIARRIVSPSFDLDRGYLEAFAALIWRSMRHPGCADPHEPPPRDDDAERMRAALQLNRDGLTVLRLVVGDIHARQRASDLGFLILCELLIHKPTQKACL